MTQIPQEQEDVTLHCQQDLKILGTSSTPRQTFFRDWFQHPVNSWHLTIKLTVIAVLLEFLRGQNYEEVEALFVPLVDSL